VQAAVYYAPKDLRLETRDIPEPRDGEIVVKTHISALCATDAKVYNYGSSAVKPPVVLGHEFVGTIHSVGRGVTSVREGEKVAIPADATCGRCHYCWQGQDNLCESLLGFGYNTDGSHSEYIRIPKQFVDRGVVLQIPDGAPLDGLSMTEPLACGLHAVEMTRVGPTENMVVFGDGAMGLLIASLGKAFGVQTNTVVGLINWKMKLAQELGATHTVDAANSNAVDEIRKISKRGADAIFLTVVTPATIEKAIQIIGKGGIIHLFAGAPSNPPLNVGSNFVHYNEVALTGSTGYSPGQYEKAFELITNRTVQPSKLISHRFRLSEIHKALSIWEDKENSLKIIFEFD
jgi:L-iditol 2-dehydrogenase